MSNITLFYSSIVFGIVHVIFTNFIQQINFIFLICIYSGIITSILNHYFTSYFLKFIDRIIMVICFINNTYYIYWSDKLYILYLMIIAVLLFAFAKIYKCDNKCKISDILHLLSHFIITIVNILLMI